MALIGTITFTFLKFITNTWEAKKKILYHYNVNKYSSVKEIVPELSAFISTQIFF